APGEDDRSRPLGQHLVDGHRVRDDLGVDLRLPHPAGDQLGVLGSEVNNKNTVVVMHAFSVVPHHSVQAQQSVALPKAAASTTEIDELGGQTAPTPNSPTSTAHRCRPDTPPAAPRRWPKPEAPVRRPAST